MTYPNWFFKYFTAGPKRVISFKLDWAPSRLSNRPQQLWPKNSKRSCRPIQRRSSRWNRELCGKLLSEMTHILCRSQEVTEDDAEPAGEKSGLDFESWGNFFGDSSRSSRKSSTVVQVPDEPINDKILRDVLYQTPRQSLAPVALRLLMTTCTRCTGCCAMLYDEEVIAGWSSDDSNLNTK